MVKKVKNKNVTKFPLLKMNDVDLLKKMRRLIEEDSSCLFLTTHVMERMEERKFTRRQIENCIIKGTIKESNYFDVTHGSYKITITRPCAGDSITVSAAWFPDDKIVVITVF